MIFYKHRANDLEAIDEAGNNGWGIEVDVRTHGGELFIAHDPIVNPEGLLTFSDLVKAVKEKNVPSVLLDFKEIGIVNMASNYIEVSDFRLYKTIDLIVPDILGCHTLEHLARLSPYETLSPGDGLWVDYAFDMLTINNLVVSTPSFTKAYLVSPELHRMDLLDYYIEDVLASGYFKGVCTDYPDRWQSKLE